MEPPPLDLLVPAVVHGLIVPAGVAAIVLALTLTWKRRRGGGATIGSADGLAAGLGLLAGFVALAGSIQIDWDFLKPDDGWDWLLGLAILATLVGGIAGRPGSVSFGLRWGVRLVVAGLEGWLLARAEKVHPAWALGIALAVLSLWGLLDRLARRRPGITLPALLATIALIAAAVLELAGLLSFAQMAGVLGAVLVGLACLARWMPEASPARGAVPAFAVMVPGLMFTGELNTYSDVPPTSFGLVLAAPLALALIDSPIGSRLAGRWTRALSIAAMVALLALAAALAGIA